MRCSRRFSERCDVRHIHKESHLLERTGWLRAAVLGANDGVISTASLILGVLIASPFGTFSKAIGGFVDEVHDFNAWLIMALAGGHALAALYHHYLLRDGVLRRMLQRR